MTEGQGVWCMLQKLVLFNFFQNNGLVFKGTDSYGTLFSLEHHSVYKVLNIKLSI